MEIKTMKGQIIRVSNDFYKEFRKRVEPNNFIRRDIEKSTGTKIYKTWTELSNEILKESKKGRFKL